MFKFVKYEIKGTYKYILGILALVLVLFTGIYNYVHRANEGMGFEEIFMGLSILVLFGTALTTFLYIVNLFKKELYEDRGYLTFSLPLTGNQIIGSKLIVALLWFFILGTGIALYNMLLTLIFMQAEIAGLFDAIRPIINAKVIIIWAITGLFSVVSLLLTIYFSMALGRVTFRNKRIGGLWFIIFIVVTGVLGFIQTSITEIFPFYLDIYNFHIGAMEQLSYESHGVTTEIMNFNIASGIYNIIVSVALFLGTGYLIEKKIDL
jgi:ABC-2 type transport system permease protein